MLQTKPCGAFFATLGPPQAGGARGQLVVILRYFSMPQRIPRLWCARRSRSIPAALPRHTINEPPEHPWSVELTMDMCHGQTGQKALWIRLDPIPPALVALCCLAGAGCPCGSTGPFRRCHHAQVLAVSHGPTDAGSVVANDEDRGAVFRGSPTAE